MVELNDCSGRLLQENVTSEQALQSTSQATPSNGDRWSWFKRTLPRSKQSQATDAIVAPTCHEISYTAVIRGQHKLQIQVYPDPTQVHSPVRIVTDLNRPYGIAVNSCGEMVVAEQRSDQVSVFDTRGQRDRIFWSCSDRPEQMIRPAGISVDDVNNVYVTSQHKLQKFTSSGDLIKCVGQKGSNEGECDHPRGVTMHSNQVYVCDLYNHRIQVFDLDLNFIQSIGSYGEGKVEFDLPHDVAFDDNGKMYVADYGNKRVQMMESNGQFVRTFGHEGEGKLSGPTALHVADMYVYVSDWGQRSAVYQTSGHFVTSFRECGDGEGEFSLPLCITSCASGFIYVCDSGYNRLQIFE